MTRITLYSKPGCHLCDEVKDVIDRVRARDESIALEVRNILDDSKDFANYQFAIPIVMIDGEEIARYRLTEPELIAALVRRQ